MFYDLKLVNCNMKRSLYVFSKSIILACLIVQSSGYAQKYDNNWISGNSIGVPSSEYFLYSLNFNNNLQYIPLHEGDSTKIWMSNGYHSSFSNKEGELKFFSNGVRVYNSIYSIMENGDTLNPGWIWNESNKNKIGYQSSRGITALPSPGMPEKYSFLIHQGLDTSKLWYTFFFANPLYVHLNQCSGVLMDALLRYNDTKYTEQ